jgi:SAM-dependent methyltransferase
MSGETSQEPIWSHFQSEGAAKVFRASHARHAAILRKIGRLAGGRAPAVLNIGVGDGNLERKARELGWEIFSLDPDQQAIERLGDQGIQAKAGFVETIPFADAMFDFVVASEVLEHLTDHQRRAGLLEIRRKLKPGGYFIGTVPYREDLELNLTVCPKCRHVFHRWGHTTAFDLAGMRDELAAHFGEISCRRTAFVEFRGRTFAGKCKSLIRLVLARCGAAIAVPTIFFVARNR